MSAIVLNNNTRYVAQFRVSRNGQSLAHLGIMPGSRGFVPTTITYAVVGTTVIDGNVYASAPIAVMGARGFLAEVVEDAKQGTYEFTVSEVPGPNPDEMMFEKTWIGPVTFDVMKDGITLHTVVVPDSFTQQTLSVADTYAVEAVINGITTDTTYVTDPNAIVTATADNQPGAYTLVVS